MNFDTVHEYYFGDGCVHLHYCTDHETLIVVNNTDGKTNRLMLNIPQKVLDEFRLELNKDSLEKVKFDDD